MQGPTEALAEFVAGADASAIPKTVRESARTCLLDYLGVLLAGAKTESGATLSAYVRSIGGTSQATVVAHNYRTCCHLAALANGVSAHALELDDGHLLAHCHPGVTVIPAAMAMAEAVRASGSALLAAIAVGYEVTLRLGDAITPSALYDTGVNVSAVVGTFGAAAAASRFLGLDRTGVRNALGIACLTPVASNESALAGAGVRDLYGGWPSMTGVVAAELARAGVSGAPSILEGTRGVCANVAGDYSVERLHEGLGSRWYCTEVYFKRHAACSLIHPAIDAALELRASIGDLGRISAVDVETHRFADAFSETSPVNATAARYSTPFCVALALKLGSVRHTDFGAENLRDPDLCRLAGSVRVRRNPSFDKLHLGDESRRPCRVTVHMKDGVSSSSYVETARGTPGNPLTSEELKRKFLDLASPAVGEKTAHEIALAVSHIDALDDIGELVSRLR